MKAWLQRAFGVLLSVAVVLLTLAPLHAQEGGDGDTTEKQPTDEELAAARALFVEAKALESEGKWKAALKRLEKVAKVKMTPQVRFHIALCHENVGRLVEAINGFELAVQEAEAVGAQDVIDNAPPRAAALRERVAYVVLDITGKVRTSKVFLDDREVSLALAGTKIPIDPGSHRVEVRRDGKVSYHMDLEVGEAESHKLDIAIHDPKPAPVTVPVPPPPPPKPIPREPETEMKRLPAYILAGAGVLAFVGAGVFWGLREETVTNITNNCADPEALTGCDPNDREIEDTAQTYDVASKVLLGVGAVSLASGAVLWFLLAPDDGSPTTGNQKPNVVLVPTLGGFLLSGSF